MPGAGAGAPPFGRGLNAAPVRRGLVRVRPLAAFRTLAPFGLLRAFARGRSLARDDNATDPTCPVDEHELPTLVPRPERHARRDERGERGEP